jgi:hypothetical protein
MRQKTARGSDLVDTKSNLSINNCHIKVNKRIVMNIIAIYIQEN